MLTKYEIAMRVLVAGGISLAALVDDCRRYRISNKIIITGFILQLALMLVTVLNGRMWLTYIFGGLAAFIIMTVLYMFGGVGAGDVKLLGVVGLLVGFRPALYIVTGSICIGAVVGIAEVVFKTCGTTKVVLLGSQRISGHSFHYTIAIAVTQILLCAFYLGGRYIGT